MKLKEVATAFLCRRPCSGILSVSELKPVDLIPSQLRHVKACIKLLLLSLLFYVGI